MWMLPLYLHVNQKSDYDMIMTICYSDAARSRHYVKLTTAEQSGQMHCALMNIYI